MIFDYILFSDILQKKTQADSVELMTLRRACELQKDDIYKLELKLEGALEQVEHSKREAMESRNEAMKEFQVKLSERESEMEKEKKSMETRLHDVLSNEANLLNRIKSLENDEGIYILLMTSFSRKFCNLEHLFFSLKVMVEQKLTRHWPKNVKSLSKINSCNIVLNVWRMSSRMRCKSLNSKKDKSKLYEMKTIWPRLPNRRRLSTIYNRNWRTSRKNSLKQERINLLLMTNSALFKTRLKLCRII